MGYLLAASKIRIFGKIVSKTFSDKFHSQFEYEMNFSLPPGVGPWVALAVANPANHNAQITIFEIEC